MPIVGCDCCWLLAQGMRGATIPLLPFDNLLLVSMRWVEPCSLAYWAELLLLRFIL